MPDRRSFITTSIKGGALLMAGAFPFQSFAETQGSLTIICTGDIHGKLDAFSSATPFAGLGGLNAAAMIIDEIRKQNSNVLLLDAGDMLPFAPSLCPAYVLEILSKVDHLLYDAVVLSKKDIRAGVELLHGKSWLITDYDIPGAIPAHQILPWKVVNKAGVRVGIFTVNEGEFSGCKYPQVLRERVQTVADKLNLEHQCNFVIFISRSGENCRNVDNEERALIKQTYGINVVISAGAHNTEDKNRILLNKNGQDVLITSIGWGGLKLEVLNYALDSKYGSKLCNVQSVIVGKQTSSE